MYSQSNENIIKRFSTLLENVIPVIETISFRTNYFHFQTKVEGKQYGLISVYQNIAEFVGYISHDELKSVSLKRHDILLVPFSSILKHNIVIPIQESRMQSSPSLSELYDFLEKKVPVQYCINKDSVDQKYWPIVERFLAAGLPDDLYCLHKHLFSYKKQNQKLLRTEYNLGVIEECIEILEKKGERERGGGGGSH